MKRLALCETLYNSSSSGGGGLTSWGVSSQSFFFSYLLSFFLSLLFLSALGWVKGGVVVAGGSCRCHDGWLDEATFVSVLNVVNEGRH